MNTEQRIKLLEEELLKLRESIKPKRYKLHPKMEKDLTTPIKSCMVQLSIDIADGTLLDHFNTLIQLHNAPDGLEGINNGEGYVDFDGTLMPEEILQEVK